MSDLARPRTEALGAGVAITVDGRPIAARPGDTVLRAALEAGLYIPHLCFHPGLAAARGARPVAAVYRAGERIEGDAGNEAAFAGCGLCLVSVNGGGEPCPSCDLVVAPGLAVRSDTPAVKALRRSRLAAILATHPHACLTCAQKEGCSREPCSAGVPVAERCCRLLGRCELEKVAGYIGIPPETPRYVPRGLPAVTDDPLFSWQPELCIGCLRCVTACADLKGVGALGFVLHGGAVVAGQVAASRRAAECRFCGVCVAVCPTGALSDRLATGADPGDRLVPCRHGCPAGMDVPRFLRAVAQDRLEEAAAVVLDRIPLPNSLGRVCFHPCEEDCRRADLGGPLSVCRLRRHVFDALGRPAAAWPQAPASGTRVAVVGAGPAGLAAAHFLRRLGHDVAVFEAAPEAGGMLRYGIPGYRLPAEVLQRDLELLADQGIEVRTGTALGRDVTLGSLHQQGFPVVLIAVGAGAAKVLRVPGAELDGVALGVDFLRGIATGQVAAGALAGRSVVVIGGGNVAIDAARSAVRLGAAAVMVACLEKSDEMSAYAPEVGAAQVEGVSVLPSWGLAELLGRDGKVRGARLVRCLSVFDGGGRFAPRIDATVIRELEADAVVLAIGQEVERELLRECGAAVVLTGDGLLESDPGAAGAGMPRVFACGDVCLGPSSVVRSVASGRRAAEAIDRHLGGSGEVPSSLTPERPGQWLGRDEGFAARARVPARERAPGERRSGFAEVEGGLEGEEGRGEAARCLQCDLRLCLDRAIFPPLPWRELSAAEVVAVPPVGGVYQLLGSDRVATKIAGVPDLRSALEEEVGREQHAPYFTFDADPMYTKRESEVIQVFLAQHGRMPAGDGDLDDLF